METETLATALTHALNLRKTHPRASAREVLDLVSKGQLISANDADWLQGGNIPVEARVLKAAAFDRAMTESEWLASLQPSADPALRCSLEIVWEQLIFPQFVQRYGGRPAEFTEQPRTFYPSAI